MYRGARIGIVIPAYNEEGFIGPVIDTIPDFVDNVFIVDDCSTDGTWQEIKDHVDRETHEIVEASDAGVPQMVTDGSGAGLSSSQGLFDDRVVPVRHQNNSGRGAAIKTGYQLALMSGVDIIAVLDGDGQMDPEILNQFLDPIIDGEAEYTKGNRLSSLSDCTSMSRWRLFGNVLLTALTKVASGQWRMRDPQNGYTAISATALNRLDMADIFDDYGFLNDMLIHLDAHGMVVKDIPMKAIYGDESSGIRYKTFVPQLSVLLLKGYLWRIQNKYFS